MKKILILLSCLLFVGCGKSTKLDLNKIYNEISKIDEFKNSEKASDEIIENVYGINKEYVDEITFVTSDKYLYAIVLPKNDKKDMVKKQFETYFEYLESQATMYNPENLDLLQKRLEVSLNDYFIYIVSTDNKKVFDIIKK